MNAAGRRIALHRRKRTAYAVYSWVSGVLVAVPVGVAVPVAVDVPVGVRVAVDVGVAVDVFVAAPVFVSVGVRVAVPVLVAVDVGVLAAPPGYSRRRNWPRARDVIPKPP